MQQATIKDRPGKMATGKPSKLTKEEIKLLWEAIQAGQNSCYLCRQCGRPCGKTFSSENSCELMIKLKEFSELSKAHFFVKI